MVDEAEIFEEGERTTVGEEEWLTDEQYAKGHWWLFTWLRVWRIIISTRSDSPRITFNDQKGLQDYVPVWVWQLIRGTKLDEDTMGWRDRLLRAIGTFLKIDEKHLPPFKTKLIYDDEGNVYEMDKFPRLRKRGENLRAKTTLLAELKKKIELGKRPVGDPERENGVERARYWVLSPNLDEGYPQSPREPFHMIPKWLLWKEYKDLVALKNRRPLTWIEYRFTGCPQMIQGKTWDGRTFVRSLDYWIIKAYRTGTPLPYPAHWKDGKIWVPIRILNERALAFEAHWRGYKKCVRAEDVYRLFQETKRKTNFNPDPEGLLNEKLPPIPDEDQQKRLDEAMAALFKNNSMGAAETQRKIREYYESWLDKHYDWFLPSEFYDLRNWWYDFWEIPVNNWSEHADRTWKSLGFYFHMISPPVFGPGGVDFSKMRMFLPSIEVRRDFGDRIIKVWQMTKSILNLRATGKITAKDVDEMRTRDWGGPRNPDKYENNWMYMLLRHLAESYPARALELLGPVWIIKKPSDTLEHAGVLISEQGNAWAADADHLRKYVELGAAAMVGTFPKRGEKGLDGNYIAIVRDYDDEIHWSEKIEYRTYDPYDFWRNQKGITTPSRVHYVNLRLDSAFPDAPHVRLNWENVSPAQKFMVLMAQNLPTQPILDAMGREFKLQRRLKEVFVWPKLEPYFIGLEDAVLMAMADDVDEMHFKCDRRLRLYARLTQGGKRQGLRGWQQSDADYAIKTCKYGARINKSRDSEVYREGQQAIYQLRDLAWRGKQVDMKKFWVRSVIRNPRISGDVDGIWEGCSAQMRSGLHPDFAIDGMRLLLSGGFLKGLELDKVFRQEETQQEREIEKYWEDEIVVPYLGEWTGNAIEEEMYYERLDDAEERL